MKWFSKKNDMLVWNKIDKSVSLCHINDISEIVLEYLLQFNPPKKDIRSSLEKLTPAIFMECFVNSFEVKQSAMYEWFGVIDNR